MCLGRQRRSNTSVLGARDGLILCVWGAREGLISVWLGALGQI